MRPIEDLERALADISSVNSGTYHHRFPRSQILQIHAMFFTYSRPGLESTPLTPLSWHTL